MSRHSLRNLILLLAVIGLGIFIYLEPGKEPEPTIRLTALEPATITTIRILRAEQTEILLARDKGAWSLQQPLAIAANPFRVQAVLRLAQSISHAQYSLQDIDSARFGLDNPEVILQLDNLELAFGGTDPLNFRRYARAGETLHLIDDIDYHHLKSEPAAFVDLKLLPKSTHITELTLPGLHLRPSEKGGWTAEPGTQDVSADALQALIDEWQQARAINVQQQSSEPNGETILVTLDNQDSPLRFLITQQDPELVLLRSDLGLQYHFPKEAGQRLLRPREPEGIHEEP